MNIEEIILKALKEDTLAKALTIGNLHELERVLKGYKKGQTYETCFTLINERILKAWEKFYEK